MLHDILRKNSGEDSSSDRKMVCISDDKRTWSRSTFWGDVVQIHDDVVF